jgi:AcrR family transcriptional regulator
MILQVSYSHSMPARSRPQLSSRKAPKQARSTDLVAAILQAAIQVLAKEGAQRFTTTRVAERAGVSVGSIYQYFPNKAAILFRLQRDEWEQTTRMLCAILQNPAKPPLERLRELVHAFIRSECDEADMRTALHDAAPLYRDAPEARDAHAEGDRVVASFLREVLPHASDATRAMAGEMIKSTLAAVGKEFSETPRRKKEIAAFADAMADMFCAYLERCAARDAGSVHRTVEIAPWPGYTRSS